MPSSKQIRVSAASAKMSVWPPRTMPTCFVAAPSTGITTTDAANSTRATGEQGLALLARAASKVLLAAQSRCKSRPDQDSRDRPDCRGDTEPDQREQPRR